MREQKRILVADIDADPEQPRKIFDPDDLRALGENMKVLGQLVDIIVYLLAGRYIVIDGERRWRAALLAGIKELSAQVFSGKPTAIELMVARLSLDGHRSNLTALELCDEYHRLQKATGWLVNEIAANVNKKQPQVSKIMGLKRLPEPAREALNAGLICIEKAAVIASEPDPAKQLDLLKTATTSSREQLRRQRARGPVAETQVSSVLFPMPGGTAILLKGQAMTLTSVVETLSEALRILKKNLSQHYDIRTAASAMRDAAKATKERTGA